MIFPFCMHRLLQFHLHWGDRGGRGSEHRVDGERFMAELHMVHMNIRYGTLDEALMQSDGVAVLGVIYEDDGTTDEPLLKVG